MLLIINLILNHCRQYILDIFANLFLFEWLVPGVPGGVTVLLIFPSHRREILIQAKNLTHTFRLLEDDHLIGILDVIFDIQDMLIKHTAMIFTHGYYQHKAQGVIQVNKPVLGSELISVAAEAIGLE